MIVTQPISIAGALALVLTNIITLFAVLWPNRLPPELEVALIAVGNSAILLGALVWAQRRSTSTAKPSLPVGTSVNQGSAVVASVIPPPEPTANAAGTHT